MAFLFTGDSFIYLEWKLHWISESKFGEQFLRITDDGSNTPETSLMLDVTYTFYNRYFLVLAVPIKRLY